MEVEDSVKAREEERTSSVEVEEEKDEVALQKTNAPDNGVAEVDHEAAQEADFSGDGDIIEGETVQEKSQKPTLPLTSGPITASTTGSGEGGSLREEEEAIYRAKMAEQRRLAKERLAEQER